MGLINPQAASFLVTGSKDTACMFIHGFTASPSEVYTVADCVCGNRNNGQRPAAARAWLFSAGNESNQLGGLVRPG